MSFSRQAVKRPVFTVMATLIIVVLGVFSLLKIPVDLMPDTVYPVINVTTTYENAGPKEVEELITKPLERVLSSISGVKELSSTSSEGSSSITLEFDWGSNLDEASNDIRERIDRVISILPEEAERPIIFKFNTADMPIMALAIASNLHPVDLKTFINDEISYRLERVKDVASASVYGGLDRRIKVEAQASKLKALNFDLNTLPSIIKKENTTVSGGETYQGRLNVPVRTVGEIDSLEKLANINLGIHDIRLKDIAEISDSWAKPNRIIRIDQQDGLYLSIFKQSGSNTVVVADAVKQALKNIENNFENLKIIPSFDSSDYIKKSINGVMSSAIQGGFLAIFILLLFLQNWKSTFILAVSIPVSIIATFTMMYFWGLTLNVLTLGALALGVGMLVDNSIVVLENIFRLRSEGYDAIEAAAKGSEEVAGAVTASTLTTLAVFLPMIFIDGIAGILFHPYSLTIAFALICSLIVALSLIPMLSGRLMSKNVAAFGQPQYGKKYFIALERLYLKYLDLALKNPKKVLVGAFILLFLSLGLVTGIGTEFMPKTDESSFRIYVNLEPGSRLEYTSEQVASIEKLVSDMVPETQSIIANIGGGRFSNAPSSHIGELRVKLVPIKDRERSVFEIMDALRPQLNSIPGAEVRLRATQSFVGFGGGGGGGDSIEIEIKGNDFDALDKANQSFKSALKTIDGITDVRSSKEDGTREQLIIADRERAADLNINVNQISSFFKTALSGSLAGQFRNSGKEYDIMVSLKDGENLPLSEILNLSILNSKGKAISLASLVKVENSESPLEIMRNNQSRTIILSADYSGRSLGDISLAISEKLKTIPLPLDISYNFVGELKEQNNTFQDLFYTLIMAILLVYMVMACQFEQLKGPLVVMFSVPFAAIGVIVGHFVSNTNFSINSFIGVIMLTGIVVNNAIILIDHANYLRRSFSYSMLEALMEAGRRRLRPILMTTLTTILGLVPLSLGIGEGGESQAPLAIAVIGGLTSSTFITLFVVPAVYKILSPKVNSDI